ncbi:malate dehydrogenase, mitochondrial [Tanacetum coccineum]
MKVGGWRGDEGVDSGWGGCGRWGEQATPKVNLSDEEIAALTKQTQDGGTKVMEAKAEKGPATLSMA